MVNKISENLLKEQKLEKLKAKAELEALRAKINPHFFFNTLNSITSLISPEPQKAEELIEKFSDLFRYPLNVENKEFIELNQEIDFIKLYLEIEKVRLDERLTYDILVDKNLNDFLIPSMILQPLVENSIIHGISPLKSGGKITIQCTMEKKGCCIRISDSGIGFSNKQHKKRFGIRGVQERLKLLYESDHIFEIKSENGVEINIVLPFYMQN